MFIEVKARRRSQASRAAGHECHFSKLNLKIAINDEDNMEQRNGLRFLSNKNDDVDTRCVAVATKQVGLRNSLVRDIPRGGEIRRKHR